MTITAELPAVDHLAALATVKDVPWPAKCEISGDWLPLVHAAVLAGATWPAIGAAAAIDTGQLRDMYWQYARAEYRAYLVCGEGFTRADYGMVLCAVAHPDCPSCRAAGNGSCTVYSAGSEGDADVWSCHDCAITWTTPGGADPTDPPPPLEQVPGFPWNEEPGVPGAWDDDMALHA